MRTHYDVLGVSSSSSSEEIKAAYKRLAIQYHPDKNPGDSSAEEKFKEVNNSYQVLSDPYQRSNYDFIIAFQASASTTEDTNTTYSTGSGYSTPYTSYQNQESQHTYKRPKQKEPRYSRAKEEKIAMVSIAVFLGLIFFVVVGAGAISSYKEEQRKQEVNEKRLATFGKVITSYQEQDYATALKELERIITGQPTNKAEAEVFQLEVIEKVTRTASEAFESENYQRALTLLLLLEQYNDVNSISNDFKIALCYRKVGSYLEAIQTLEKITIEDKRNINAFTRIGDIYSNDLKDYKLGLEYYNKAGSIIVTDYTSTYGSAFSMLVPPSSTPDSHFELYSARAKALFNLGNYKKTIEDINWATFLRPKKSNSYILQGDCFQKLNQQDDACSAWKKAEKLGNNQANSRIVQYCR